jgi:hypothetical protein
MLTYAILWPSSNLVQQCLHPRPEGIDWKEMARFSFFGCIYTAPTIYAWVRIIGIIMPGNTLKIAVSKVRHFQSKIKTDLELIPIKIFF